MLVKVAHVPKTFPATFQGLGNGTGFNQPPEVCF